MFSLWFPDLTSWLWWSGPTQKVKDKPFSSCNIFTFEKIKARPVGQRSDLWPFGAYRLNPSCGRTLMEDGSRRLVGAKPGKSWSLFKPNFSVLQAPTAASLCGGAPLLLCDWMKLVIKIKGGETLETTGNAPRCPPLTITERMRKKGASLW